MTIPFNLEGALLRKEDLHAMIVDEGSASIVTLLRQGRDAQHH